MQYWERALTYLQAQDPGTGLNTEELAKAFERYYVLEAQLEMQQTKEVEWYLKSEGMDDTPRWSEDMKRILILNPAREDYAEAFERYPFPVLPTETLGLRCDYCGTGTQDLGQLQVYTLAVSHPLRIGKLDERTYVGCVYCCDTC